MSSLLLLAYFIIIYFIIKGSILLVDVGSGSELIDCRDTDLTFYSVRKFMGEYEVIDELILCLVTC